MSLISNVSSRVGNSQVVNSARNFLNTPAKKVIVIVAVAAIIALGLYLLGRCCPCRRRISAKSANSHQRQQVRLPAPQPLRTSPTPSPTNPTSRPTDPAPSPSIPLTSQTTQTAPNRTISTDPASVPDDLFNNDGQLLGASHFQQYSQGEMTGWLSIFAHRRVATFYPDNGAPKQDIVNLGCLNQAHWITADSVRSHRGLVNFNTDPNSVPDDVFTTGENGRNIYGITHYRQLQNGQGGHHGWLLISETKKNAVAHIDGNFFVWAFPTDQTGWINADDVRKCKQQSQSQPLPGLSSQSGQPELELSGDLSLLSAHLDQDSSSESSSSSDQPAPTGPNPALESSSSGDQQAPSDLNSDLEKAPSPDQDEISSTDHQSGEPADISSSSSSSTNHTIPQGHKRPRSGLGSSHACNRSKFSQLRNSKQPPTMLELAASRSTDNITAVPNGVKMPGMGGGAFPRLRPIPRKEPNQGPEISSQ